MEKRKTVKQRQAGRKLPLLNYRLASDAALVAAIRVEKPGAFETLYDRYSAALLSFCRHMLGNREEAEDALQQTFLAAYRQIKKTPDQPINLRPWLYTVARNQCLSVLRTRGREVEMEGHEPVTEGLATEVERHSDLQELLGDLSRLPADQRAALVLTELEDLSHQQIAEALGCETEKVKSLVFQARSSLLSSREARNTPCSQIREQLSILKGGSLRRNNIRRHLKECAGCREFKSEVNRQHKALALLLPVVPTVGLKGAVIAKAANMAAGAAATGAGTAASTGGGVAAAAQGGAGAAAVKGSGIAAGLAVKGSGVVVKVAVAAALAGGGTAASVAILHAKDSRDSQGKSSVEQKKTGATAGAKGAVGIPPGGEEDTTGSVARSPLASGKKAVRDRKRSEASKQGQHARKKRESSRRNDNGSNREGIENAGEHSRAAWAKSNGAAANSHRGTKPVGGGNKGSVGGPVTVKQRRARTAPVHKPSFKKKAPFKRPVNTKPKQVTRPVKTPPVTPNQDGTAKGNSGSEQTKSGKRDSEG